MPGNGEQAVIGDADERIDFRAQFCNPFLSNAASPAAFKCKRECNDTDGERAKFFCNGGNHGRGSCACASPQAGGYKYEVGIAQCVTNLVFTFSSCSGAY